MLLQTIEALFRKYRLFCYQKLFAAVRDWCGAGHLAVFTTQVPHEGSDLACPLCWMPPGCSCVCLMQSRCTTLHWSMAALARPLCLMASWPPTY